MQISVRSNIKEVTRGLSRLEKKYVPKATRNAINETLFGLGKALSREMQSVFDEPTAFTTGGEKKSPFIYEKADLSKFAGEIRFKKKQAAYLRWQVYGGTQKPKKRAIPVPTKVKRNKYGNLAKGWQKILQKPHHFSGVPKGTKVTGTGGYSGYANQYAYLVSAGIWKRMGATKKNPAGTWLQLQISWEEKTEYQKQFHFHEFSRRYIKRHFAKNFREKLRWYVQNRK